MSSQIKINYKEYPEYMFAIIAAYLPENEGDDLRLVAGQVVFRHQDWKGNTYKNGQRHREGDLPAFIHGDHQEWYNNGLLDRECDLPAVIDRDRREWYKNGVLHREGDRPAIERVDGTKEWWVNYEFIRKE